MDAISLRAARCGDAAALGVLHVASWRETYAGLLPRKLLDDLSAEARSAMWIAVLCEAEPLPVTAVFVAEREGKIVGFAACGAQRDGALQRRGFDGEVGAIYVLQVHQQAGLGRALMRRMARHLLGRGRAAATLWVLRENAVARRFYEKLGGVIVAEREDEQSDASLSEMAYGWHDLSLLAR